MTMHGRPFLKVRVKRMWLAKLVMRLAARRYRRSTPEQRKRMAAGLAQTLGMEIRAEGGKWRSVWPDQVKLALYLNNSIPPIDEITKEFSAILLFGVHQDLFQKTSVA
jgi:hypothetical protein